MTEKADRSSYVTILLFALASLYIYTNVAIVTYDDFWPGQITSFIRDGRVGALPLYYPLINVFEMDMHFRYVGYVFLAAVISIFLHDLARGLNLGRTATIVFAAFSVLFISSANYKLFVYKATFISVGSVFLYSWLCIRSFMRANSESEARRGLWWLCSCFLAAMVFATYPPMFLLPLLSILVLVVGGGSQLNVNGESVLRLAKFGVVYGAMVFVFLMAINSSSYIALYEDIQIPRRSGFDFSSFLALNPSGYPGFYLRKVLNILLTIDLSAAILLFSTVFYVFLFYVNERRDRVHLLALLALISLATILNPAIVLNDALAIRRVTSCFFTVFLVFVFLSFFLVELRAETSRSRLGFGAWLLLVVLVSFVGDFGDAKAMLSTLFLSLATFFAASIVGRMNVPLYAVVAMFAVVVNAQLNVVKVEKVFQMEKIEDRIYSDIMFEVLKVKRLHKSDRISVYVETDYNNFRDSAPSYSRIGYFTAKNFLPGVVFLDGSSRCDEARTEEFLTVRAIDENSVLACF